MTRSELHLGIAVLGVALATRAYLRTLERDGLDANAARLPLGAALATAAVLARVAFGIERGLPWGEILSVAPGGYVLYGALPGVLVFRRGLRARRLPLSPYLDRAAPFVLLALVPARIGCTLAGCCGGRSIERFFPAGVEAGQFPAPLAAAILNALLAAALLRRIRHRPEGAGALALAGHGAARTLLDPLRERSVTQGGVAMLLVVWGLARFWRVRRRARC